MKASLVVAVVIVCLVGAVAGFYFYDRFSGGSTSSCSDPASISSHIYNSYRLQIVKSCITASGTVDNVIEEADGDVHLRLNLDQAYSNLTNSGNQGYPQYGDLVVEITQKERRAALRRYPGHTAPGTSGLDGRSERMFGD